MCDTCKYKNWFPFCCLYYEPLRKDTLIYCQSYEIKETEQEDINGDKIKNN